MRTLNIFTLALVLILGLSNTLFAQRELTLKEVTVKPNNAQAIVEEALSRISENYSEQDNYLKIDYQEQVKKDGTLINHNKAKSLVYSQSYQQDFCIKSAHKNYYDKIEADLGDFVAARWYNELTSANENAKILLIEREVSPNLEVAISGGPAGLLAYDKVKYRSHFMSQGKDKKNHRSFGNQFKNYEFRFVEETLLDGRLVYVISFSPEQSLSRKTSTFEGKMYIDAKTKAFAGFDYQNISGQTVSYGFANQVVENEVHNVNIRYQLVEDKWQLAKIEVSDKVNVYTNKGELANQYQMSSSMVVSEVINENVKAFSPKEALANSLSSRLSSYYIPYKNSVATTR